MAGGEDFVTKISEENPADIMVFPYGRGQKCGYRLLASILTSAC